MMLGVSRVSRISISTCIVSPIFRWTFCLGSQSPHDAGGFTGFENFDFDLHCVSPIYWFRFSYCQISKIRPIYSQRIAFALNIWSLLSDMLSIPSKEQRTTAIELHLEFSWWIPFLVCVANIRTPMPWGTVTGPNRTQNHPPPVSVETEKLFSS